MSEVSFEVLLEVVGTGWLFVFVCFIDSLLEFVWFERDLDRERYRGAVSACLGNDVSVRGPSGVGSGFETFEFESARCLRIGLAPGNAGE